MIQLVVSGRDVVEHFLDLFALLAIITVRLDVFLRVSHVFNEELRIYG